MANWYDVFDDFENQDIESLQEIFSYHANNINYVS